MTVTEVIAAASDDRELKDAVNFMRVSEVLGKRLMTVSVRHIDDRDSLLAKIAENFTDFMLASLSAGRNSETRKTLTDSIKSAVKLYNGDVIRVKRYI